MIIKPLSLVMGRAVAVLHINFDELAMTDLMVYHIISSYRFSLWSYSCCFIYYIVFIVSIKAPNISYIHYTTLCLIHTPYTILSQHLRIISSGSPGWAVGLTRWPTICAHCTGKQQVK
jgi:hypothetical protein